MVADSNRMYVGFVELTFKPKILHSEFINATKIIADYTLKYWLAAIFGSKEWPFSHLSKA